MVTGRYVGQLAFGGKLLCRSFTRSRQDRRETVFVGDAFVPSPAFGELKRCAAWRHPGIEPLRRGASAWRTTRCAAAFLRVFSVSVLHTQRFEPLERQCEMSTAFTRHECVNLVDDDGVHVPQPFTRVRCQQQEQRLRRGDEHVARFAEEPRARGRACRRCES